jgi:hypothetical protein
LLDAARRQRFVGRRRELTSFDDALAGRTPRRVLFVHGQDGIGKTTLLAEFRARAGTAGRIVTQVDGREFDPSPDGMTTAVRLAVDHHDDRQPITRLLAGAVLLVDGYEQLTPIDGWLVPALSGDTVVVLAGREPPAAPWRTDAGWRHVVETFLHDVPSEAFGTEVTGVASTGKLDLIRSLGADHVIDYTRDDFADRTDRYDVILDIAGNPTLSRLRHALTTTGTAVIVGGEEGGNLTGGHRPRSPVWRTRFGWPLT